MFRRLRREGPAVQLVFLIGLLTFCFGALGAAGAQALKEIRIGTSDVPSTNFSIYYAKDRKFLNEKVSIPK